MSRQKRGGLMMPPLEMQGISEEASENGEEVERQEYFQSGKGEG